MTLGDLFWRIVNANRHQPSDPRLQAMADWNMRPDPRLALLKWHGSAGMDREQALAKLAEIKNYGDRERAGIDSTEVLCELLEDLGYFDVVEAWRAVPKWYA